MVKSAVATRPFGHVRALCTKVRTNETNSSCVELVKFQDLAATRFHYPPQHPPLTSSTRLPFNQSPSLNSSTASLRHPDSTAHRNVRERERENNATRQRKAISKPPQLSPSFDSPPSIQSPQGPIRTVDSRGWEEYGLVLVLFSR